MQDLNPYVVQNEQRYRSVFLPSATDWQVWEKPIGATMVTFFCVGGAAGGGNGFTGASGTARGGGAGGGSGASSRLIVPASLLPDLLYVQPGAGGAASSAGALSFISIANSNSVANVVLVSGTSAAFASNNGTGAGAATGIAGETLGSILKGCFGGLGPAAWAAGIAGSNGGNASGAVGSAALYLGSAGLTGAGAGGGGTTSADFAGGGISPVAGLLPNGVPGGAAGSNNGVAGIGSWAPFWSCGGTGGGASNTGIGGDGGAGWYGCGGGGGGGGTTGGAGGRGGDGFVIISSSYHM